ncbi:hypothetical protein D3C84_275600 [compost metagenome]
MGQRVEAGSLTFALSPIAVAKQEAYLLGQVMGQRAIESSSTKLHRHLGQVSQRTGRGLLQVVHASDTDHRGDGHRWRSESQKIKTIAQGFAYIVNAIHLVVRFGDRHRTGACAD